MILSGKEIINRQGNDIIIDPFNEKQVNPNSYNLKLHNELVVYDSNILDMKKDNTGTKMIIPEEGFLMDCQYSIQNYKIIHTLNVLL